MVKAIYKALFSDGFQWRSVVKMLCVLNRTPDMHVYSYGRYSITLCEKHRYKAVFTPMMCTQVRFCVRHATLLLKLFQSWAQGIFPRMCKSAGIDKNDPILGASEAQRYFFTFFFFLALYIRILN